MNNFNNNSYNNATFQQGSHTAPQNVIRYDATRKRRMSTLGGVIYVLWGIASVVAFVLLPMLTGNINYVFVVLAQCLMVSSTVEYRTKKVVFLAPFLWYATLLGGLLLGYSIINIHNGTTINPLELFEIFTSNIGWFFTLFIFMVFASFSAIHKLYHYTEARHCTEHITATISRTKQTLYTMGRMSIPVFSYSYNGNNYETVSNMPFDFSGKRFFVGQKCSIRIDPENPSRIYVTKNSFDEQDSSYSNTSSESVYNNFNQPPTSQQATANQYTTTQEYQTEYHSQAQYNPTSNTSTFNDTYRKSATTQPKRKFGIAGILIPIWFFGSMILFAVTSRTNINISFMILGQIPLLLGILLLFKGEDARGKKPVVPAVIMSVIGLVIVVISLVLMFGSSTDIANLSILFPVLFFVIFNIAGVSLFIGPLYYSSMNNKIHTGTAHATVVGINHKLQRRKNHGYIDVYAPIYEYNFNGRHYIAESTVYSSYNYPHEGTARDISVNPNNPIQIYEKDRATAQNIIFYIMGIAFTAMSVVGTFFYISGTLYGANLS